MTGDGIWRTITDITTAHTAWELPGIGADTTAHTGAAGAIALGDTEAGMIRGIMAAYGQTHGITEAGTATGTTQDGTPHGTMEAIGAGMIHGITITITDGITLIITQAMDITET